MLKYWFSDLEPLSYIKDIIFITTIKGVRNWKERCLRTLLGIGRSPYAINVRLQPSPKLGEEALRSPGKPLFPAVGRNRTSA